MPRCPAERECVTASNVASTMIALMINNPLLPTLDLTSLRVLSCGGSPQSDAVVRKAIAVFGCEFFVSYGERQWPTASVSLVDTKRHCHV